MGPAAESEGEKRRREDGLSPEDGVSREAPALTIDERRAAAGRAMARAREILAILRAQGAPMPLTEERLNEIEEWGEGLLQRGVDGRPMDDASRAIQQGLDEQKVSAEYVREMRRSVDASGNRVCPHYPYQSAEQEYVATRVDAMNLSAQQKDALFAMLHGEDGHPSLLRPDIQDAKRLLTRRALEDAEKNMPRCALLCNLAPPSCACQSACERGVQRGMGGAHHHAQIVRRHGADCGGHVQGCAPRHSALAPHPSVRPRIGHAVRS